MIPIASGVGGGADDPAQSVLMLCTKFGVSPDDRYLTNELADALAESGRKVLVVVIQWDATPGAPATTLHMASGVEALVIAPRRVDGFGRLIGNLSKWLGSSFEAAREFNNRYSARKFDLLISFSPLVTVSVLLLAVRHRVTRSYAYIVDFFPYHHAKLGLLPRGFVVRVAVFLESFLIRRFDAIGCMSPFGVAFLKNNYRMKRGQRACVLPLWGDGSPGVEIDRNEIRNRNGLPIDRPIAVFGGQITEGRGVEDILSAAAIAVDRRPDLIFLLVGRGRLVSLVQRRIAAGGSNIILLDAVPRDDYIQLVAACDIGIVATVANTEVPTFPSKTIDYLRAGLPIVASVEKTTDYGEFVSSRGIGLAVDAGQPKKLFEAVTRILDDDKLAARMRADAASTLADVFDVRRAAKEIVRDAFAVLAEGEDRETRGIFRGPPQ